MNVKKNLKKAGALILSAALITGFTGCGEKKSGDGGEKVKLKWVLGGPGMQRDSEEVWALFNEKLMAVLPNTEVEFEVISTTDYAEKWKLIAASSEKVDIAWHGWMVDFENEVRNGSYIAIDELLDAHAPKLKAALPEWVWNSMKLDGKIYAIPNYQMMVSRPTAIRTPEALADEYLDKERINTAFKNWHDSEGQYPTDEVFDAIEDYCGKLKEAGKLGLGVSPEIFSWINNVSGSLKVDPYGHAIKHEDGKVTFNDNRPLEENFYRRIAGLYEKGYIRKDALTVSDMKKDNGKEGGYIMWIHNYDDFTKQSEDIQYGMPIYYIATSGSNEIECVRNYKPSATNTAITRTCENPERAMQLLEVINDPANKELYNLLVYGIEGKHYEKESDNRIKTIGYDGTPTMESGYGIQKWIIGNTFNAYETQTDVPGYNEYIEEVLHGKSVDSILLGFTFDSDPVKNEIAQIKSIEAEYSGLKTGAHANWKEMLDAKHKKLSEVGLEKVIAEYQKQLDEQINNK